MFVCFAELKCFLLVILNRGRGAKTRVQIIPVIDVRNGVAVCARGGNRDHYEPISTLLADSCDPADVARGYLDFYPFDAIYLADLDGIEGRGRDLDLVQRVSGAAGPDTELWVDCGLPSADAASDLLERAGVAVVLGSECLSSVDGLKIADEQADRFVLSLDFQGEAFMGPREVLERVEAWPKRVIVMTLARVGGSGGPDLERLADISERAPNCAIFAAGGLRNLDDVRAVRSAGGSGVLVASALHEQKLKAGDLYEVASL